MMTGLRNARKVKALKFDEEECDGLLQASPKSLREIVVYLRNTAKNAGPDVIGRHYVPKRRR